jgi:hypothetical protein
MKPAMTNRCNRETKNNGAFGERALQDILNRVCRD